MADKEQKATVHVTQDSASHPAPRPAPHPAPYPAPQPAPHPAPFPDPTSTHDQRLFASSVHTEEATGAKPPTGYCATILHLVKCYVGTGIFAMGEAFKNSGLVMGPACLLFLAVLNLNCQHILVNTVIKIASEEDDIVKPTFAETVQYTMESSSINCLRNSGKQLGWITNIFLCCTELGFCCVYFVFIAEHLVKIAVSTNLMVEDAANKHIMLALILGPMWLSTFLGNLKLLLPLTIIANVLTWAGILIIVYYTIKLPPASSRNLVSNVERWPRFFGTALFAFEGITFVIPLRNEMKNPEKFIFPLGVLNVGMTFVVFLYMLVGILGYWKYGDDVEGSIFLNLSTDSDDEQLTYAVDAIMSIAVLFTFTLHMYIPFEITFPLFYRKYGPFKHNILVMCLYRSVPVLLTYMMANVIPFLGVFISLIGASAGSFLALIIPPVLELIAFQGELSWFSIVKDIFILTIGIVGSAFGTVLSIMDIVEKFKEEY